MDPRRGRRRRGKTTAYRRWDNPIGLITDLLEDLPSRLLPAKDSGSLRRMEANVRSVREALSGP
jgi:hypothetical protein